MRVAGAGGFFLAWAAEEEGGIMLICNTVSTKLTLWDPGPTVKYKPSREKSGEKKKNFSQSHSKRWYKPQTLASLRVPRDCLLCRLQKEPDSWRRGAWSKEPGGLAVARAVPKRPRWGHH